MQDCLLHELLWRLLAMTTNDSDENQTLVKFIAQNEWSAVNHFHHVHVIVHRPLVLARYKKM